MRLAPPRLGGRNPLQRQAELLLEHELMVQPRLVVRGQRDDQRALRAQPDLDAGRLLAARRRRPATAPGFRARARPALPRPARPRRRRPASRRRHGSRPARLRPCRTPRPQRRAPPAARRCRSPMTPAPMMATLGCLAMRASDPATGGSLRWHDPDRFDGCDLSRVCRGTPGRYTMMGIPRAIAQAVGSSCHAQPAARAGPLNKRPGGAADREHVSPTAMTTAAPTKMLGSAPPCAKP